jgi:hypothetical protein
VVYTGSAGVGPYSFAFEILAATDIQVYKNTTLQTLTTNYTVTINANGTGYVTLVTAAISTDTITIVGDRAIQRTTDFVTGGDLFANTLNDEFDSLVIFAQQIDEKADRGLKAPVTDPTDVNMVLPVKTTRKGKVLAFDSTTGNPVAGPALDAVTTVIAQSANINTVATNIANVNTVAGNSANVTTVAGVSGAVTTVAGISANVTSVAGNSANINTVAGNNANVTTVAGISANVTLVAGNSANINTVAGSIASVNTAAANIAAIIDAPNQATAAANSAAAAAASAASGMYSAVQDKSANYTVVASDAGDLIRVFTTSGAVTITLPTISTVGDGFKVAIVKWTSDGNAVNVVRSSTDTINGTSSRSISGQFLSTIFIADLETGQWFATNTSTNIDLATNVTGTLAVANGGTGQSTLTANNVLIGNGTSAVAFVAPGSSGNVLTSNGTSWVSTIAAGGGATGAGTDQIFVQNDTLVTGSWTLGQGGLKTCTISIASPAVVTQTNSFVAGQPVYFQTTGALPTGLSANQAFFVSATGLTGSSFQVSATSGGASINTSGSQSGTQTCGKLQNANCVGPITIVSGATVTVPSGARLVIQ